MSTTTEIFPRGYIAMGAGDLISVTNIKYTLENDAKVIATLRRRYAGVTLGNEVTTVTFDAVVGEFGEEADYFKAIKKGTIKQIRVKIPGRTITVNGVYKSIDVDIPADSEIKESLTFIGCTDD
jgi:hypothetical protein